MKKNQTQHAIVRRDKEYAKLWPGQGSLVIVFPAMPDEGSGRTCVQGDAWDIHSGHGDCAYDWYRETLPVPDGEAEDFLVHYCRQYGVDRSRFELRKRWRLWAASWIEERADRIRRNAEIMRARVTQEVV